MKRDEKIKNMTKEKVKKKKKYVRKNSGARALSCLRCAFQSSTLATSLFEHSAGTNTSFGYIYLIRALLRCVTIPSFGDRETFDRLVDIRCSPIEMCIYIVPSSTNKSSNK